MNHAELLSIVVGMVSGWMDGWMCIAMFRLVPPPASLQSTCVLGSEGVKIR